MRLSSAQSGLDVDSDSRRRMLPLDWQSAVVFYGTGAKISTMSVLGCQSPTAWPMAQMHASMQLPLNSDPLRPPNERLTASCILTRFCTASSSLVPRCCYLATIDLGSLSQQRSALFRPTVARIDMDCM